MGAFREHVAEASRDLIKRAAGASFWLKTTVNSNALSTTALNLSRVATGGEVQIEDIIIRGHSGILGGAGGGLVGGGTFRIFCTNTFGSSVVLAAGVGLLGTSKLMTMGMVRAVNAAKMVGILAADYNLANHGNNQPTILEEGAKLTVSSEATGATGDGKVTVHVKFRRLSDDADVLVA